MGWSKGLLFNEFGTIEVDDILSEFTLAFQGRTPDGRLFTAKAKQEGAITTHSGAIGTFWIVDVDIDRERVGSVYSKFTDLRAAVISAVSQLGG